MSNDDELNAAKIVGSWYWQMAEGHNFRWKNAVKSMVLFYESAPLESDMAQLVIEYLRTRASVTSLVIAHKNWTFAEPGWSTKDAWYQTVPGEQWAGTESKKVRVYWVLVEAGDGAADGPYTVENGCKYLVTHSYYWNVAAAPVLPQSTSGVQYSIQGFTRDRETGLFTYIVEKRETVQQDIALYKSAETAFEQVEVEQHLGVKSNNVATTGLQASVQSGVRIERQLIKNNDCTTDILNKKTTAKEHDNAVTVEQASPIEKRETVVNRNKGAALPALAPSDYSGKEVTRRSDKTDDQLWTQTTDTVTPIAAATDWITWTTTEDGPRHTYTYECGIRIFRNQPESAIALLKLNNGVAVSGRVSVNTSLNRFKLLDGAITYSKLISWTERSGASGLIGGSQAGSISFKYVSDYTISTAANGDITITPTFTTASISTRTYYGRGNEGSEAAAAASQFPVPPGIRLGGRTYITSDTSAIIQAMHTANTKLQAALANRKAARS